MSHQTSIKLKDVSTPFVDQLKEICTFFDLPISRFEIICRHPAAKRYHSMKDVNRRRFWCCECLTLITLVKIK
jgi:hypothetical protein